MRGLSASVVVATALVVGFSGDLVPAGAEAKTAAPCDVPGKSELAHNRHAAVAARRRADARTWLDVRGCAVGSAPFELAADQEVRRPFTLSGSFFAYVSFGIDEGGALQSLLVADLRSGGEGIYTIGFVECDECSNFHDVELRPRGSVAFISGGRTKREAFRVELCPYSTCVVKQGPTTIADKGRGIDPHSLTRRGARVYWKNGSKRRSATLG
jgi:hypothetical protein